MAKLYIVPERLRALLSREYGYLVEGIDRLLVAKRVIDIACGRRLWSVGDVISTSLVEIGYIPDVAIIDRATLRERDIDTEYIERKYREVGEILEVYNPRGHISAEAMLTIKRLASRSSGKHLVLVRGEEDLLSLAIAGLARLGEALAYGIPRRGASVVIIDQYIRDLARDLMREILGEDYKIYFE